MRCSANVAAAQAGSSSETTYSRASDTDADGTACACMQRRGIQAAASGCLRPCRCDEEKHAGLVEVTGATTAMHHLVRLHTGHGWQEATQIRTTCTCASYTRPPSRGTPLGLMPLPPSRPRPPLQWLPILTRVCPLPFFSATIYPAPALVPLTLPGILRSLRLQMSTGQCNAWGINRSQGTGALAVRP